MARDDDDAASQDSQGSQASKASTVRRALAPLQLETDQTPLITHDQHMVDISIISPEEEQQPAAADSRIVSGMTPVDSSTRKSLKDELSWALQVEEEEAMDKMASENSPEAEVQGTASTSETKGTERKQRSPTKKTVKTGSRHKTRSKSTKGGKSSKGKLGSSSSSRASSPPKQRKDSAPNPKSRPSSVVIASEAAIPNPLTYVNQETLGCLMNMLKDARDSVVVKDRNGTRDIDIQCGPIWDLKKNFLPQFKANEAVIHSEYLRVNTCDLHPTISGGESQTRPDPLDLMTYDSGWFPRAFLSREMPRQKGFKHA